jgi:hypothetical protein
MASTLADAGLSGSSPENLLVGRVPASLVVPSRALATALASMAERLEEDWSASRRPTASSNSGLTGLGFAFARANGASDRDGFLRTTSGLRSADYRTDEIPTFDERLATHRRLLNLPPPARA